VSQLREAAARDSEAEELQFVPAMVDAAAQAPVVRRPRQAPRYKSQPDIGTVEIEVDGVTIRVWQGADANMIAALVQALKASR
jgi:transposase